MVTTGLLSQAVQDRDTEGSQGTEQAPTRPTSAGAGEDPPATPATPVWAAVKAQQVFPSGVLTAQDPHRETSFPAAPQCSRHLAIVTHGHFGQISHPVVSTDLPKRRVTTSSEVTSTLFYKPLPGDGSNSGSC